MANRPVSVLPVCAAAITLFGTVAVTPAHADNSGTTAFRRSPKLQKISV